MLRDNVGGSWCDTNTYNKELVVFPKDVTCKKCLEAAHEYHLAEEKRHALFVKEIEEQLFTSAENYVCRTSGRKRFDCFHPDLCWYWEGKCQYSHHEDRCVMDSILNGEAK